MMNRFLYFLLRNLLQTENKYIPLNDLGLNEKGQKPEKIEKRFTKDVHGLYKSFLNTYGSFTATIIDQIIGRQRYPDYIRQAHPKKETGAQPTNVLIYFGESLSSKYMSIFGYGKPTTPFLSSMNEKYPYMLAKETISGSVATATSTELFFNLVPYPDSRKQVASLRTNLFRYADESGLDTGYFTSQAENYTNQIYRKIGKKYIKAGSSPFVFDNAGYGYKDGADDIVLLDMIKRANLNEPYFIALQPNGSHPPFNKRSPAGFKKFGGSLNIPDYENSVLYTDSLLEKIIAKVEKSSGLPWVVVITSDHGTYVDNQRVSRSHRYSASYTVPGIIVTNSKDIFDKYLAPLKSCQMLFHQQIAEVVANIIGYDVPVSGCGEGILSSGLLSGVGGTKRVVIEGGRAVLSSYEPRMTQNIAKHID